MPPRRFTACVNRCRGDPRIKAATCLDQFYCMTFAQLTGRNSSEYYPELLRQIHSIDVERNKRFLFLTNNFNLSPRTIVRLYRFRRQIELRFKERHL